MLQRKQSLLAAIASTIAAVIWLVNCVMDAAMPLFDSLLRDALLTLICTVCAVCWWVRWSRVRRTSTQMPPSKEGETA